MNSEQRYRSTLMGMTPSPAWRRDTLAAMEAARGKRPRRRPMAFAATAAALALAVTGGIWWSGRTGTDPNGPGVALTPEPAVTATPVPAEACNDSFDVVTNLGQLASTNPSDGHLEELTQLNVYYNPIPTEEEQRVLLEQLAQALGLTVTESQWTDSFGENTMGRSPTLEARCADGTQLRLNGLYALDVWDAPDLDAVHEAAQQALLRDAFSGTEGETAAPAVYESKLNAYDFDGRLRTTRITVVRDPEAPLEEQILATAFRRIESTDSALTLYLPPTGEALACPLRPEAEALAAFRSGDYWGAHYTANPQQARVLQVVLEYDTGPGQPYFQPVYRILYTQDYWDTVIADRMFDGVDPSPYLGAGIAYVPALETDLQPLIPYRRYFNDGLAHHLPD